MKNSFKKYRLEDIHVGMKIASKVQLSCIYDKWIILVKKSADEDYTIGFIGDETNVHSDKLFNQNLIVCPVYNDSIELEGDVFFEE